MANLLAALQAARRIVYISTSGVYGDCAGALVDESRAVNPGTARAQRRVNAEEQLQRWCTERGAALVVLRAPGIYAADRLPLERLRAGTPVLRAEDDVYTNHIHADDLAAAAVRALEPDAAPGVYNVADDSDLRMAQWMDLVAGHAGLPKPPRLPRSRIAEHVAPEVLSFMTESRRLDNRRMKTVLGVKLRLMGRSEDDYEHVADRAGHDVRYAIESGKLRQELDWRPRFEDFEKGLADTIDWYTGHRDWWGHHKHATEAAYAAKGQ